MTQFFTNKEVNMNSVNDIVAYGYYHPYRRGKNPAFDYFSGRILDLKQSSTGSVEYFHGLLAKEIGTGFSIAVVPSHDPANIYTGCYQLAGMLINSNGLEDGRNALRREHMVAKKACGGARSVDIERNSITISPSVKGKKILLLDDVTTTGCSLNACRKLLLEAGALEVACLALAQTA